MLHRWVILINDSVESLLYELNITFSPLLNLLFTSLSCNRECITAHASFSDTAKILNTYELTESSSIDVKGESIEFKSGVTKGGDTILSITASNDIEHQHWIYALDLAIARLRKDASKVSIISHPFQIVIDLSWSHLSPYRLLSPLRTFPFIVVHCFVWIQAWNGRNNTLSWPKIAFICMGIAGLGSVLLYAMVWHRIAWSFLLLSKDIALR